MSLICSMAAEVEWDVRLSGRDTQTQKILPVKGPYSDQAVNG